MNIRKTVCILLGGALLPLASHAEGNWSLGAGAGVSTTPYKGVDTKFLPLPLIGYEGDHFYFEGLETGYRFINNETSKFAILTYYSPLSFKPSDSNDSRIKRMDKRHGTMMGGLSYEYTTPFGKFHTVAAGDYLDISNGITWDNSWTYEIDLGDVKVMPQAGVTWSNGKQNQYYYGVSQKESNRSGLTSYKPGSSWDPYVEIDATYDFTKNWSAYAGARYTFLSSEVKNSPLVDKSGISTFTFGATYVF